MTSAGLRQHLRAATRDAHDAVDAAAGRFDLTRVESYAAFLQAHASALLPLEAGLEAFAVERLLPDWRRRARGPALRADLAHLAAPVAPPVSVPTIASADHAWGRLYVLEGSRLGARFLLAQVNDAPESRVREATAYLAHGRDARLWPEFLAALEAADADRVLAVEGASDTFAAFRSAFMPKRDDPARELD